MDRQQWETFFARQRSPVLRSQVITALQAGTPFAYEAVPTAALLDVAVVARVCRYHHTAEVVDDYTSLLRRIDELWKRPDWTTKVFDQAHAPMVSAAIWWDSKELNDWDPHEYYAVDLIGGYLELEEPLEFFDTVVTDLTQIKKGGKRNENIRKSSVRSVVAGKRGGIGKAGTRSR